LAGDEGYEVWGVDELKGSSDSESVRSAINIVESPGVIILSSDEMEGNQSKGSVRRTHGVLDQRRATAVIQILN